MGAQIQLFHNTINLIGAEYEHANNKAISQQDKVFEFFKDHPDGQYTAAQVYIMLEMRAKRVPLTSIRRAISDLKHDELLIRTDNKKTGFYGVANYKYQFNKEKTASNGKGS